VTDDAEKPSRPNANYKLSKPDYDGSPITEEQLVFYYNREHRLANAPQSVRDIYAPQKKPRFSLIRPLIADKPRAMLFIAIIVMSLGILVFSGLGYFDSSYKLDGNEVEIVAAVHEGTTLITLRKAPKKEKFSINRKAGNTIPYTGAVDIAVSTQSAADSGEEDFPIFYHRVFFTLEPEEVFSFTVPFEEPDLLIVLQTEKTTRKVKILVK
jgi:hypothetical protein